MADMEVTLKVDNTEQIKHIVEQQVLVALEAVGLQAEGYTKENIVRMKAVDTGRLLNSITHGVDTSDSTAYVGTNVEYAPYVEYGTVRMPARPYLKNAVNNHKPEYKAIFEHYLRNTDG